MANQIVNYLSAHPAAADSVEGILNWWLAQQRYDDCKLDVECALVQLEERNVVKKTTLADGSVIYSRR